MDKDIRLFRKRIIPDECVELKNDKYLFISDDIIVTSWNALHPKKDLHHGFSCYFLKKGIKVSKFYKEDNSLMYWYCDIIDVSYANKNSLVITDLLVDVLVYPDGYVKVIDIDELAECMKDNRISSQLAQQSLAQLDSLLKIIYNGEFDDLCSYINRYDSHHSI